MTNQIDELRRRRDQLNARIQKAEARLRATEKRADDRVKVLVGAAVLSQLATGQPVELQEPRDLLNLMNQWLARPSEREAVLGADLRGSAALRRTLRLPPPEN